MNAELLHASNHALTSVINGLYQGVLLAGLVGLALRFLPGSNAATRHAVWLITLTLLAGLIPAQWCRDALRSAVADRGARWTVDISGSQASPGPAGADCGLEPGPGDSLVANTAPSFDPETRDSTVQDGSSGAGESTAAAVPWAKSGLSMIRGWLGRFVEPVTWELVSQSRLAQFVGILFVAGWIGGSSTRLAALLLQLRRIRRLKASSVPANDQLETIFQRRRARFQLARPVDLRVTDQLRSPLVLGFCRPVILLPEPTLLELDAEQCEQIIAHELAHVRRGDDWLNLFQQLVQAALFFHPAVSWIAKRLALEREIASDDLVLEQGGRPKAYARVLLNLASRLHAPTPRLAPGASTSKSQLQQRITMILNTNRSTSPRLAKTRLGVLCSVALLVAVLALVFGPRLILASNDSPEPSVATLANSETDVTVKTVPEVQIKTELVTQKVLEISDEQNKNTDSSTETGPKFKGNQNSNYDSSGISASPRKSPKARGVRVTDEDSQHGSMEERLDRLEKMVQALAAQQSPRRGRPEKQLAELDAQKMKEAERAKEMTEPGEPREPRVAREMEKAKRLEARVREQDGWPDAFQGQLKALEKQKEALQREMERLDRQMDKVRHEYEQLQEKMKHRSQVDGEDAESNRKGPGR